MLRIVGVMGESTAERRLNERRANGRRLEDQAAALRRRRGLELTDASEMATWEMQLEAVRTGDMTRLIRLRELIAGFKYGETP